MHNSIFPEFATIIALSVDYTSVLLVKRKVLNID